MYEPPTPPLSRTDFFTAIAVSFVSLLGYLPFLGKTPLLDWDELIYGEAAREMFESGNFLQVYVNYSPFWEKPPLYFWLQAFFFHVFGVNEGAARLPSALFFALTLGLVFLIGAQLKGRGFGFLWAGLMGTALLPVFYSKYGIIDPVFNFFIIAALFALYRWDSVRREGKGSSWPWAAGAALAIGLAVTTKGPLALGLVFIIFAGYKVWHRKPFPHIGGLLLFVLSSALLASSWYLVETLVHGPWFIESFIRYQRRIASMDDGHPGPVYYHLLVFFVGCFPFSPFVIAGLQTKVSEALTRFKHFGLVWATVVLLIFSLVIQTKLPHYSSLLYVPGSFFAALRLESLIAKRKAPHWAELAAIALLGLLIAIPPLIFSYAGQHIAFVFQLFPALKDDPLAIAYINLPIPWPLWTYLTGGCFLLAAVLGTVLLALGRVRWGLLATGGLVLVGVNALWAAQVYRFSQYAQSIPIAMSREARNTPRAMAFYGPKTYVPPFYGQRQVHNPANEKELRRLLAQLGTEELVMIVRRVDLHWVEDVLQVRVLREEGPFLLVETSAGTPAPTSPRPAPAALSSGLAPQPLVPPAS